MCLWINPGHVSCECNDSRMYVISPDRPACCALFLAMNRMTRGRDDDKIAFVGFLAGTASCGHGTTSPSHIRTRTSPREDISVLRMPRVIRMQLEHHYDAKPDKFHGPQGFLHETHPCPLSSEHLNKLRTVSRATYRGGR